MSVFNPAKDGKIIEHNPHEFSQEVKRVSIFRKRPPPPKIQPLVHGCPTSLERIYQKFRPRYRDGLKHFDTHLEAIEWHRDAAVFIGIYKGYAEDGYVRVAWAWINGEMVELDQDDKKGRIYPIDLRWMEGFRL